ncbi:MAG: hypothetical protein JXN60_01915, partial [Lentisphaerae bacterium]|nr:hypothetical protein [Lentisphaerota bacterium]
MKLLGIINCFVLLTLFSASATAGEHLKIRLVEASNQFLGDSTGLDDIYSILAQNTGYGNFTLIASQKQK